MSSVSDSRATFRAKALQHGIPESALDAWDKSGIATYSQLLFRVASAPNQTDPAKLQALLDSMEPKADPVVTSAVHRLLFEAGTFVVAELRQTLEAPTGEAQPSSVDTGKEQQTSGSADQAWHLSHSRPVRAQFFSWSICAVP